VRHHVRHARVCNNLCHSSVMQSAAGYRRFVMFQHCQTKRSMPEIKRSFSISSSQTHNLDISQFAFTPSRNHQTAYFLKLLSITLCKDLIFAHKFHPRLQALFLSLLKLLPVMPCKDPTFAHKFHSRYKNMFCIGSKITIFQSRSKVFQPRKN
jgi:hypothetical protein